MNIRRLKRAAAFTLFEVVLGILILLGVIGMVMGVAMSSGKLSSTLLESSRADNQRQALLELLRQLFVNLPGNAQLRLMNKELPGGARSSELIIQNIAYTLQWGRNPMNVKALRITSEQARDLSMDVVLEYYDVELLNDSGNKDSKRFPDPVARIVLMRGLALFDFMVRDASYRDDEWELQWEALNRLPNQIEANLAYVGDSHVLREVYWVPPRQNPEVIARQFSSSGGMPGGGGRPEIPGGGELPEIPGGGGLPEIPGGGIPGGGGMPGGGGFPGAGSGGGGLPGGAGTRPRR